MKNIFEVYFGKEPGSDEREVREKLEGNELLFDPGCLLFLLAIMLL